MTPSELLLHIAARRGIGADQLDAFLHPQYTDLSDPFSMHDMAPAVDRIFQAMDSNEKICIYADYDADGIPGAALLSQVFKKLGYENFITYIPHRHTEGYGFHTAAIKKLADDGVQLIITIDVGITAATEVAFAQTLGLTVIVTDHHEPNPQLPQCLIVHPKLGTYADPMICGCAVAFQLSRALLTKSENIPEGWEKWLLDLVGIATIGDMVPLVNENRILATYGLRVLQKSRRAGIVALCRELDINQSQLVEEDLGFSIIPRLNAASRMATPQHALDLLTTESPIVAQQLAVELSKLNTKRKNEVVSIMKRAHKHVAEIGDAPVIVIGDNGWNVGVIGIVAGKVSEEYRRPTFVWTEHEGELIKGSCRSDGTVSVVAMMEYAQQQSAFTYCGGHAAAGGFTAYKRDLAKIETLLIEAYKTFMPSIKNSDETVDIQLPDFDAELQLSDITMNLYTNLAQLAPFGVGNPRPTFLIRDMIVSDTKFLGKTESHIKLTLTNTLRKNFCEMVAFNVSDNDPIRALKPDDRFSAIVAIESNTFAGRTSLRLKPIQIL